MNVIGVIAEFNPFHLGHKYLIDKIKEMYPEAIVIGVISSCFMQRGEISIMNKINKTEVALRMGFDLLVELPFVYATQAADIFAKGAISILNMLGVDTLVFGMESDDTSNIEKIVDIQLNNQEYNDRVNEYMRLGYNYPTSLNMALKVIGNVEVKTPNDLLALSYIKEIKKRKLAIEVVGIKRTNNYHGKVIDNNIVNASLIRKMIIKGEDVSKYIGYDDSKLYRNINGDLLFKLLKYQIIMNRDRLNEYMTVDEGIENRIIKVIDRASNWEELVELVKSKRYTYNRINRMFIHILCGFLKRDMEGIVIDYIRLLGFSKRGQEYLRMIKKDVRVPIISSYKKGGSKLMDVEIRVNDIYAMIMDGGVREFDYNKRPIRW